MILGFSNNFQAGKVHKRSVSTKEFDQSNLETKKKNTKGVETNTKNKD